MHMYVLVKPAGKHVYTLQKDLIWLLLKRCLIPSDTPLTFYCLLVLLVSNICCMLFHYTSCEFVSGSGTCQAWVLHARHGCYMPGMGGTCQAWVVHVRHGCYMPGMGVTCQVWVLHANLRASREFIVSNRGTVKNWNYIIHNN